MNNPDPRGLGLAEKLIGRRLAILATDAVKEVEITEPLKALENARTMVELPSPESGEIEAMCHPQDYPGTDAVKEVELAELCKTLEQAGATVKFSPPGG